LIAMRLASFSAMRLADRGGAEEPIPELKGSG